MLISVRLTRRVGGLAMAIVLASSNNLLAQFANPLPATQTPRGFRGFMPVSPGTPATDNTGIGLPTPKNLSSTGSGTGGTALGRCPALVPR